MKKILAALCLLTSFASLADISLTIKTPADMSLKAIGVYVSSSTSFFCSQGGEGFERHPKIKDRELEVLRSGNSNKIIALEQLGDRCGMELQGFGLYVIHPKVGKIADRLELADSNENQDQKIQQIKFVKIASPYGDFFAPKESGNKILVGPNGAAKVEISLVE